MKLVSQTASYSSLTESPSISVWILTSFVPPVHNQGVNSTRLQCRNDRESTIEKAEVPAPLIRYSMASASCVAYIMYQKYQLPTVLLTGKYNQKTPRQALQEQSKKLRRTVYEVNETMKGQFSAKNTEDSLEKELEYCKQLISTIKENETICSYPKVQEKLNLLEEAICDDLKHLDTSKDGDAKIGHKTADTSFFGYKTHIAMTEEKKILMLQKMEIMN